MRAPAGSLFEVASALCGVRAQLPLTAELALWARIDGLAQGEVKQALEDERTLVKTWIRNTLNVVPADDLALYVAVLRPRPEGAGRCLASSSGGDAGAVRGDREERPARARRAAANA